MSEITRIVNNENLIISLFILIIISCSRQAESPFPPVILKEEFNREISSLLPYFGDSLYHHLPASVLSVAEQKGVQNRDSIVLYRQVFPSKEGAVVAYQEWVDFAEAYCRTREFIKGIGKKALLFQTDSAKSSLVFYQRGKLYGVMNGPREAVLKSGRKLSGELDKNR